jgi:hypothetical protein
MVAAGVENLRINGAGRVLIGTTTDDGANTLQVEGPAKLSGAVTAPSFVGTLNGNVTGNVTGNVSGTAANVTGVVAIASGGTGAITAAAALANLGAASVNAPTLTNPTIKGYIEQFQALNPGAAVTLNPSLGTVVKVTTSQANTTITLPAFQEGKSFTLIVKWGATGHAVTFAGGTLAWIGAATPGATSVAGKRDIYTFMCDDEGTIGRDGGRGA